MKFKQRKGTQRKWKHSGQGGRRKNKSAISQNSEKKTFQKEISGERCQMLLGIQQKENRAVIILFDKKQVIDDLGNYSQ